MKQRFSIRRKVQVLTDNGYVEKQIVGVEHSHGLVYYRLKDKNGEISRSTEFYLSRRKKDQSKRKLYLFGVEGDNLYKVGISTNPKSRRSSIQSTLNKYDSSLNRPNSKLEILATSEELEWAQSLEFFLFQKFKGTREIKESFNDLLGFEWFRFDLDQAITMAEFIDEQNLLLKLQVENSKIRESRTQLAACFDILHFCFFGNGKFTSDSNLKMWEYRKLYISDEEFENFISAYLKKLASKSVKANALQFLKDNPKEYFGITHFETYSSIFTEASEIKPFYKKRIIKFWDEVAKQTYGHR